MCVGEGETSVVELVDRLQVSQEITTIPGIWCKQDGRIIANGPAPLTQDLDGLPFPDYSFDDHHLLVDGILEPMTAENWRGHLCRFFPPLKPGHPSNPAYQIVSARGCPYVCSFCGEAPLAGKIYGRRYFRKRSIDNVIRELEWAKETFPFIGEICFCDDTFPSRSTTELRHFVQQYQAKIGLPFYVLVTPVNVVKDKFDLLVDAGLTNVGMGIQSGSPRTIKLYNRERCGNVQQSLPGGPPVKQLQGPITAIL